MSGSARQWSCHRSHGAFIQKHVQVYEGHLPDAFAAMLDMSQGDAGPVVYFYCLSSPRAAPSDHGYNAFAAAHHVVLDTSIPFEVTEVSLGGSVTDGTTGKAGAGSVTGGRPGSSGSSSGESKAQQVAACKPHSEGTGDTFTTNGTADTQQTMQIDSKLESHGVIPMAEDDTMSMSVM